jgi:hypothetical protein
MLATPHLLSGAASLDRDGETGRPDMVKPPLRTKSIGFKVSQEEYAQLETKTNGSS